eukprot:TRINITY_DN10020_c2_g1_i2.p1 TRINITY_DN10020_c2_g1~~TRINITY_DN10020_c2_g1_i2.p1  ORF type:complete len:520 (-),score=75.61 TRINITY_DN10020_c2_g1_i2:133-1692(-)
MWQNGPDHSAQNSTRSGMLSENSCMVSEGPWDNSARLPRAMDSESVLAEWPAASYPEDRLPGTTPLPIPAPVGSRSSGLSRLLTSSTGSSRFGDSFRKSEYGFPESQLSSYGSAFSSTGLRGEETSSGFRGSWKSRSKSPLSKESEPDRYLPYRSSFLSDPDRLDPSASSSSNLDPKPRSSAASALRSQMPPLSSSTKSDLLKPYVPWRSRLQECGKSNDVPVPSQSQTGAAQKAEADPIPIASANGSLASADTIVPVPWPGPWPQDTPLPPASSLQKWTSKPLSQPVQSAATSTPLDAKDSTSLQQDVLAMSLLAPDGNIRPQRSRSPPLERKMFQEKVEGDQFEAAGSAAFGAGLGSTKLEYSAAEPAEAEVGESAPSRLDRFRGNVDSAKSSLDRLHSDGRSNEVSPPRGLLATDLSGASRYRPLRRQLSRGRGGLPNLGLAERQPSEDNGAQDRELSGSGDAAGGRAQLGGISAPPTEIGSFDSMNCRNQQLSNFATEPGNFANEEAAEEAVRLG